MLGRFVQLVGAALLAVSAVKADSWGPAWSLGPTHGTAAIVEATTHFTPGKPPNPGVRFTVMFFIGLYLTA